MMMSSRAAQKRAQKRARDEPDSTTAPTPKPTTTTMDPAELALQEFLFGGDAPATTTTTTTTATASATSATTPAQIEYGHEVTNNAAIVANDDEPVTSVWQDDDDACVTVDISSMNRLRKLRETTGDTMLSGTEYAKRLRRTYNDIHPPVEWATKSMQHSSAANDDEDDVMQAAQSLLRQSESLVGGTTASSSSSSSSSQLSQDHLTIIRVKDVNMVERCESVVAGVEFHRSGSVALTVGLDKTIRVFQVDGIRNPKLQSVHLGDLPVRCASFSAGEGTEIIASGRRKWFYTYNMLAGSVTKVPLIKGREERSLEMFRVSPDGEFIAFAGKSGTIILVSALTKQWVANLKMNGGVTDFHFSSDGDYLYSVGTEANIYIWDVRTRRCVARQPDEGAAQCTRICLSPDGRYCAVGSDMGVVNVYRTGDLHSPPPPPATATATATATQVVARPVKALMNLTTRIDHLSFSHDSQLLAMSSRLQKDALRLVHVGSMTTYSNWPTQRTPLHYVQCHAFSPNSGYFTVGNDRGIALLYRLPYYERA